MGSETDGLGGRPEGALRPTENLGVSVIGPYGIRNAVGARNHTLAVP